ncbi:hypothetical protein [uncultured Flavonifractor sp.]|uniref:hypothetical protein n=1 Tax=uncultured Flavonifractor sp. TaxID=1193534 RepID=UPI00261C3532|nr:hypothetical protein [uncultured Flavonifractor sp.]
MDRLIDPVFSVLPAYAGRIFLVLLLVFSPSSVKVRGFMKECLHPRTDCVKMSFTIEVFPPDGAGMIVRGYHGIPKG